MCLQERFCSRSMGLCFKEMTDEEYTYKVNYEICLHFRIENLTTYVRYVNEGIVNQ